MPATTGDIRLGVTVDDSQMKKLEGTMTKASTMGNLVASGLKAVGQQLVNFAKTAVESYGRYEQLMGGVERLYGEDSQAVAQLANEAASTVQMSANDYLEQFNGFSAKLQKTFGDDTEAMMAKANEYITMEADIIAATGVEEQRVTDAFNGIMRGQYLMLDNLQLGYDGTKTAAKQLINDMNELHGTNLSLENDGDIFEAIKLRMEDLGMTGVAAAESMTTIEGSMASLTASWENFGTALVSGQDIEGAVEALASSLENVATVFYPVITTALTQIDDYIVNEIKANPEQTQQKLKSAIEASVNIATLLMDIFVDAQDAAIQAVVDLVNNLISSGVEALESHDLAADFSEWVQSIQGDTVAQTLENIADWFSNTLVGKILEFLKALNPAAKIGEALLSGVEFGAGYHSQPASGKSARRNGLDYVPEDGYVAELHKGEMVLTQQEADDYRENRQSRVVNQTFNITVPNNDNAIKTALRLRRLVREEEYNLV